MPAQYDRSGLTFQYPENWELEDGVLEGGDAARGAGVAVSVTSPGGGFWTVISHRGFFQPQQYVESALQALRETYHELDTESVEETIAGHRLAGYNVDFISLDTVSTARVRGVETHEGSLLILCQADDREFERIEPVFRAMTVSLLNHQTRSLRSGWPPSAP
jgi:hypothetical protein